MDVGEYIRNKQRQKQTASTADRYAGMSEEQLMQELFRVGRVSSGNVSAKDLDDFYARVKGFLTPEQSAKMRSLILQLKME